MVGDLPLVVGFDGDARCQAQQGGVVGEDPDDVGAALDLSCTPARSKTSRKARPAGFEPATCRLEGSALKALC